MNINEINSLAIYPPIGIARIGNSDAYFLASDIPGMEKTPDGGYKDRFGKIKKQVARFRVYAFDKAGIALGEVKSDMATIKWTVDVANVKAAWYQFNNAMDLGNYSKSPSLPRNNNVIGSDRSQLAIIPSQRTIQGQNQTSPHFDDGSFYGTKVDLGHLQTDEDGRLLFFSGNGGAASKDNIPATTFANNDGWHDDTCDGVIRATVEINGKSLVAEPAVVAVTPPNFGPGLYGVVTMNDVVQDMFIREMNYPNPAQACLEFWKHIYPIFERMTNTQWVNQGFFMLFGKNSPSDFTDPKLLNLLKDPSESSKSIRERVFSWFRNPQSTDLSSAKVPPFYGDGFSEWPEIAMVDLPLTITQYDWLSKWASGNFIEGKPTVPTEFELLSPQEQIDSLNQAPLEECLGGPFHPGIELTWPMREKQMWQKPYRLKIVAEGVPTKLDFGPELTPEIALGVNGPCSVSGPGSLTRWLGVPWQTDEASCLSGYTVSNYLPLPSFWAARVPNQVLAEDGYLRMKDGTVNIAQRLKHFDYRQDWLRDIDGDYLKKINLMVKEWNELGIVTREEENSPNSENEYLPELAWIEKGRNFREEDKDPTFAQVLFAEKAEIPSLEAAAERRFLLKASAPKSSRVRRTLARDER
ncbi:hypothetical protein EGI22_18415 [Lacihabitans sp. LS3-19]|uniref:LodA/GoxA family CTQ-dependent oxidase n=1 Tax=Lacihabitans sp. LS3-19 TaxID=2487335 RepID=UPI0020CE524C|nr:LodA/GoxA family CTQ-dependent oxidase [Lacihabitans sp. LS3-19]MCP9769883.1 hypothetical protein [Lacihabitans sp. LS3-19]